MTAWFSHSSFRFVPVRQPAEQKRGPQLIHLFVSKKKNQRIDFWKFQAVIYIAHNRICQILGMSQHLRDSSNGLYSFIFTSKSYSLLFSEPACLAELERIQVLDGGNRRFGRYLTSHEKRFNPTGLAFSRSRRFVGQMTGITPRSVMRIRT